jgi:hypothetical protein
VKKAISFQPSGKSPALIAEAGVLGFPEGWQLKADGSFVEIL